MEVIWSKHAKHSFSDELEFILLKWSLKEVENFITLVETHIEKLKSGTIEGQVSRKTKIRRLVISKQTTLFFELNKEANRIELLLFWNNKRDPKELMEMLNL